MKTWLQELLAEKGTQSMIRLLSLLCIITASTLAFIGISASNHSLESVSVLCGTFLAAGMGAKVMQKKYEHVPSEDVIVPVQDVDAAVQNSTLSKE